MTIGSTTNKSQPLPVATQTTTPAAPANARSPAEAAAAASTEASAKVALSTAATALLAGAQSTSSEFDAEKVERISRSIEKGEYAVDAGAIADKLIANAAELLTKTPPKS